MSSLVLLIAGMALATYVSRVSPFFLLPKEGVPVHVERFLKYVPAAAIGALIFPDVLQGPEGHAFASLLAAAMASLLALKSRALWVTVGGAIAVAFLAISFGAV